MPSGGFCFEIDHVDVDGVKTVSSQAVEKITRPYEGGCIGLGDIHALMKAVSDHYIDKGYIAARVYIPDQDIKATRVLKLLVAEGQVHAIYYNGALPERDGGVIKAAFPSMVAQVLNMRDVEQGLDQMNRLASNNAKVELLPGFKDGTAIVNITNQPEKRWQARVGHDTLGQTATGHARYNADLTLDNVFGLNDLWHFGYQRTNKDYWHGERVHGSSNSYSGSVSIPYGYWTFNASGYFYDYDSVMAGTFSSVATSGDSAEARVGVNRLVHRDGKSLTFLNFDLAHKQTDNFLLGSKIEVGSRDYTVAHLGLSHSRRMLGGIWSFDVGYLQGLSWFGATRKGEPGAGDAEPSFQKYTATFSIMTPFTVGEQNFILNNLVVGQYAADNLYGGEQIALGGYSNVRGVRESLVYANSGFFSRNELSWRFTPWHHDGALLKAFGELRPYIGLDYGQVFSHKTYHLAGHDIASWSIGARLVGGLFNMDAGYSRIFSSTVKGHDMGQDNREMGFITLAMNF